jgi:hypothetical protein
MPSAAIQVFALAKQFSPAYNFNGLLPASALTQPGLPKGGCGLHALKFLKKTFPP